MPGFTFVNLAVWSISLATGVRFLSDTCYVCAWGVATSFSTAFLLDDTVFARQRDRLGIDSRLLFHSGNVLVHIVPLRLLSPSALTPSSPLLLLSAPLFHLGWGVGCSNGTLCLDDHYASLAKRQWRILWWVAVLTELGVSAVLCL
jgi:hypothetical protein